MDMINALVERQLANAVQSVGGERAVRALKSLSKLAARQGGANALENYQLLGKRAAVVGGVALAVVQVGGLAAAVAISRRNEQRRIEKTVRKVLAEERAGGQVKPTFYQRIGKRACDIVVSTAALPVVGVVCATCGAAIKREDGGPVFYNAPRVGKDGREFKMYKLRSMQVNAPDLVMEDGSTYNGADDPRMTRVGAFMRRTSLDEIPQFLNVLKGDMSVVGPRPDLKRETELYQGDEALKLTVKPGVTGYAAVYGRNSLPWHDRLALDVEYVRNMSFPLDVKIFLKTFSTVFKQEGIYVEGDEAQTA